MRMGPNTHGYELSIADDLGRDIAPDCCDEEMTAKDFDEELRNYTCGNCGTVVTVDELGLVFDIREKQAA